MKYRLIAAKKAESPLSVKELCALCGVSSSGYYAYHNRPASRRQRTDMVLLTHVRAAFKESNESYGSPRMVHELRDKGLNVGRRRIARLMRENGMKARQKARFKRTTDSHHSHPIAPNILGQDFNVTAPNQVWVGDISYIWTKEGWLYLAVVIDLYARRVVGWETSERLHKELPIKALKNDINLRKPTKGLIFHSDRGSQYCSYEYIKLLQSIGAVASMSGKGNCYDNAVAESFFKTIKAELIWKTIMQSRTHATHLIRAYIETFYNAKRRHSACEYKSPIQFELINK
jgi:putative transposase